MTSRRWWDVALTGVMLIIVPVAFLQSPLTPAEAAGGVIAVVLVIAAYLAFARPDLSESAPPWRHVAFVGVGAVALGVGVAAIPFLAMLQVLVYPLLWVTAASRRPAIVGSAVVAVAVFLGFVIGGGFTANAFISGTLTGLFSLAISIALGLWIESIAAHAEERGRLVAQLEVAQTELEALASERGASAERERLARDIHDTLAQTLAGLVILAERAGRQSRDGQVDAAAVSIATVEQIARDALAESRALVARTAAVPSEPALGAAVERLAERFRAESGLTIDVDLVGLAAGAADDREAQVVALRCLQEGLANVRKHAGATRVSVLVASGSGIRLVISDDGRGFDDRSPRTGYGLDGMRERLALAGGTFEVQTAPGDGTTLRIGIPLYAGSEATS